MNTAPCIDIHKTIMSTEGQKGKHILYIKWNETAQIADIGYVLHLN